MDAILNKQKSTRYFGVNFDNSSGAAEKADLKRSRKVAFAARGRLAPHPCVILPVDRRGLLAGLPRIHALSCL